ncbi:MAG: hypothetical protein AB2L26_06930 [Ignavibacteria bacterium]
MSEFKLEAIKCKNCGSGLMVEINDFVTYCTNCGSGFEIVNGLLQPIEVNFAQPARPAEGEIVYKPFWILKTNVTILERTSSGGFLKNLFGGNDGAGGAIKFYIPAFRLPVDNMREMASAFTIKDPVASPRKFNVKVTGFTYGREDALKIAEFLLISFEAEKSDTMKTFRYDIKVDSYEILGIPFYKLSNGTMRDAIIGMSV